MKKRVNMKSAVSVLSIVLAAALSGCGQPAAGELSAGETSSQQEAGAASAAESGENAEATEITLEVVGLDGSSKSIEVSTKEKNLGAALVAEGIIEGEESEYGLFVTTVDGVEADASAEEWWCLTKNGEMVNTGVDGVEIADGEKYEFTLVRGYDTVVEDSGEEGTSAAESAA